MTNGTQDTAMATNMAAAEASILVARSTRPPVIVSPVQNLREQRTATELASRHMDDLESTENSYPLGVQAPVQSRAKLSKLALSKLVVDPPESPKAGPLLIACVTACNESYTELKHCLDTFKGRCPADLNLSMVYVFLDACPEVEMQSKNATFQALVSIMGLEVPVDKTPVEEGGCRVYRGMVGYVQARLYVKGRGPFQRSKRRSITAFYSILAERIASGVSEEPVAVLHMDGDTGSALPHEDNTESSYGLDNVAKMMRIMERSNNLGAVASQVRVLQRSKNALTLMQSFDCSTTYVGVFGGSSLIGRSIACFGMAVMYRYRALLESRVEGVPTPMAAFSRTPGKNLVDLVNLDMNEDQGMTTFIMRAGYDTKVCVVTRFSTYAPETLAELMGQRRRWQAGYFVGMPSQVFSWPSPHLQTKNYRWVMAFVVMSMWINAFLLPGTVGVGLALLFGQAYGTWSWRDEQDVDSISQFVPEAAFAVGVWIFWLLFIATTMDKAPKKIRNRCRFFFATACLVSVGLCVGTAVVSSGAQTFLILMIALNLTVGLALTYDWREWAHRLQEIILYVVFLYAIQPMITMYSVANIDSALWGTRSVGDVNATAKVLDEADAQPRSRSRLRRRQQKRRSPVAPSREFVDGTQHTEMDSLSSSDASDDELDEAAYYEYFNKKFTAGHTDDVERGSWSAGITSSTTGHSTSNALCDTPKKKEGNEAPRRRRCCCRMSLRRRKFLVLTAWVLLNMAVTVTFLLWRLHLVVVLNFFSNFAGLVTIVVAARIEAHNQRRWANAEPPPGPGMLLPSALPTVAVSSDGAKDAVVDHV